ncbi:MAG: DUF4838 domain-containing protein [Planctomycetes bacterium]|nr:DUF4838 domain-containing protein [Planctomycetota bacterium]
MLCLRPVRRRRYLFPATLVLLLASACGRFAAAGGTDLELVRDGVSDYVLIVARAAAPAVRRGAEEVQTWVAEITGARLPIRADDGPLPARAILVGPSAHTAAIGVNPDPARLGDEGFVLRTVGARLVAAGAGPRGTLYACVSLLDRLGVRWYTPSVTRVPRRATLVLPALDESSNPAFEYREPFFTEAQGRDWAFRNRINGHFTRLDADTGGKVTYCPWAHSFDLLIPPDLYADHPEYFPLIGGARAGGYVQRCLTNPEVQARALERIRDWIRQMPDAQIISVSQNDTDGQCLCAACRARVEAYGAPSGLYLEFVNRLAAALETEHPDKKLDMLAYWFTEAPPRGIAPRKNVRVRLCPIRCCQAHPYAACTAPPTGEFRERLRAWAGLTDALYIWHYNTDFANYLLPFPDFDEFPAELRLYRELGVKGVFCEGAYAQGGGGSDAELRSWVMARLLWDPAADADALVTEWMTGVYGAAAGPMRAWFDLLHGRFRGEAGAARHLFVYDPPMAAWLSEEMLAAGTKLFDQAEALAAGDATAAEYVAKARLALRYARLARAPREGEELDAFLAEVRRRGITELREGQAVAAWEAEYRKAARAR